MPIQTLNKKQSNWVLIGYLIGFVFSFFSAIRYFLLFPDTDRALVYVGIGFIVIGLSWAYSQILDLRNKLDAVEEYLDDRN